MQLVATLDYGPLKFELSGENREEIEQDLLEIVEFIEENEDTFAALDLEQINSGNQTELDASEWEDDASADSPSSNDSPLQKLAQKLRVSKDALDDIVYVDPDGEEAPQLLIDGERLGDSVPEKQKQAALIILTVFEECYGEDTMRTSKFKDILAYSDISDSNLYRAWDDSVINQSGKGEASTIKLKGRGRREATQLLKELAKSGSVE